MCGTMVVNMENVLADVQKELEFCPPNALRRMKEAQFALLSNGGKDPLGAQRIRAELNALKELSATI